MGNEQEAPTTSQDNRSQARRFQFSLKLLFVALTAVAVCFVLMGWDIRTARDWREAQRIVDALPLREIVDEACPDVNLRYNGAPVWREDLYRMTALWSVGPNDDIPAEALVRLEEETKRRLKELGVEAIDLGSLQSGPVMREFQVGYRYRSFRGVIQFRLTRYEPPEEWARVRGGAYLTGVHIQFR